MLEVKIKALCEEAIIPQYAHEGDAGFDLCATEQVILTPGERALVKTGIAVQLPEGFELQVRPRSGLALKQGITVLNTPGTVDSGYRGEIGVILINHGTEWFQITPGMRIAQGVISRYEKVAFQAVESLDDSSRSAKGFGSTGV